MHRNTLDNGIGAGGVASLAPQLRGLTRLAVLNLGKNELGDDGFSSLAPNLPPCLLHLDLEVNDAGPQGALALGAVLATLTHLQHLSIRSNIIRDEGVSFLAPHLPQSLLFLSLMGTLLGFQ
mmetsp:Transcript_772/g.1838  ORF Transcript_772/g.1838 Transcript_772/m.1838 type:complete len:122 (-) Transcript_772:27-392(-)